MTSRSAQKFRQGHKFSPQKSKVRPPKYLLKIYGPKRLGQKYGKPGKNSRGSLGASTSRDNSHLSSVVEAQTAKPIPNGHKALVANENNRLGGEITAVPNPVPDTGLRPTLVQTSLSSVLIAPSSVHSVALSKTGLPTATFSASPPLLSLEATPISGSTSSTSLALASPSIGPQPPGGSKAQSHQVSQPQRKFSIPVIVLLAVGSALLVAGLFVIIKCYSRPARRSRPKPSRPILDVDYPNDKRFQSNDSPIFGGKERNSSLPGSNGGMWAWTTYPQPEPLGSKANLAASRESSLRGSSFGYGAIARSPGIRGKPSNTGRNGRPQYHFTGHAHTQSAPIQVPDSPYQPTMQQVQGALLRATSRISATSMSMYPASPQSGHNDVGIAIGGASPGTAFIPDGYSVLNRTDHKTAVERSQDHLANPKQRYSQGSAYGGADVASPTFLPYMSSQVSPPPNCGGRTRIKSSYYTPSSYPRSSNVQLSAVSKLNLPELQYRPSIPKSESKRDQDTQALTCALGLASPGTDYALPSPQPTLYPDDSLSVVEAKRPRKSSQKKKAFDKNTACPSLPVIPNTTDASATLGSLMLMDFDPLTRPDRASRRMSMMSIGTSSKPMGLATSKSMRLRSDDKPPYIPLPAPLPSLTQMGLEHVNPQAYADYRSPTYSIYGLYESERKSGARY